jgi:effector-binding domain-containing protein
MRETEARQRVQQEAERLQRVEALLRQIEQEDGMSKYDVVMKSVEAIKVASVRDMIPSPSEQGGLWGELEGYLAMQRVRPNAPCFTLYHNDDTKGDWDVEVCEPITGDLTESKRVKVQTLPAASLACTIHHGPFVTIPEAYAAVGKWIETNGYRITGPCREIYLNPTRNGSQNDPDTVTEIQFPVEKA